MIPIEGYRCEPVHGQNFLLFTRRQTYTRWRVEFWPKVADRKGAAEAAHTSAGICYFVAIVTACASVISVVSGHRILGIDGWGLVDAALFALFGWRIWKLSTVFAVLALLLYCAELAWRLADGGGSPASLITVLFIWGLVHGIRGTFAYKRLSEPAQAAAPMEQTASVGRSDIVAESVKKNWKRWAVVGISTGVGLAITIALIGWSVNAYDNRSSDVKEWPTVSISGTAAAAKLTTQWNGDLKYIFRVVPSSSELSDAFRVATNDLSQLSFTLLFYDHNGF
jgi:hypothetical protein